MAAVPTPQKNIPVANPILIKEGFWHRHLLAELISVSLAAATLGIVYMLYWNAQVPTVPPLVHHNKSDSGIFCAQVITSAKNSKTGEVKDFPTPCDVPDGWQIITGSENTK